MKEEEDKYYLVIYSSETIVFDRMGKKVVACPTEDEAVEFIRKLDENKKGKSQNGD